jgi:hypothetical protein
MPGQLANYIKNVGKFVIDEGGPFLGLLNGLGTGLNIFWNLKKFDDPNLSDSEKGEAIFNTITVPLSFVPIVNTMVGLTSLMAPYISDVILGKKDPPPISGDVNSHNFISKIPNKIISSPIFQNYFRNY